MPNVLIHADTIRSPELRHEVPISIVDGFTYIEQNGTRFVFTSVLEVPRIAEIGGHEIVQLESLGLDELIDQGLDRGELDRELVLRACRHAGIDEAVVPAAFPIELADHLRANGIDLTWDRDTFDRRRRVKNAAELEGIRRAQRGTEAAMDAIRSLLREREGVTSEELRVAALGVFAEHGLAAPDSLIVSHGAQTAVGHEDGHGEVKPGEPVVCDLFPQDTSSGCFTDMTRTFCVGEPPEELVRFHALCRESLELVYEAVRPGITGAELHRISCKPFEDAGVRTQLSKDPGEILEDGYFHSLGHGVGLEVHEEPTLGRTGRELVEGDVIAIEPGAYRKGFGGCRLEDLVLVTADGCEPFGHYPYDLAP